MNDIQNRIIFPLDDMSKFRAREWCCLLDEKVAYFKIGLELFLSNGPKMIDIMPPHRFMLDLKLHDIPTTMEKATRVAASYGVSLLTIHASAGKEAMRKCVEAAKGAETNIVAVTILTSLVFDRLRFETMVEEAVSAGVTHFVCSPNEAKFIKFVNRDAVIITPGISLSGEKRDDQQRVNTPIFAVKNGASYIVVGRPIREAKEPLNVIDSINQSLRGLR